MPQAAPRPCAAVGCGVLVRDGSSRCPAHKVVAGTFADKRRGSRHERGYGTAWDKQRKRILKRDGGICQACLPGAVHAGTEVDHIVPKEEGGTDDDANLRTICSAAHKLKTAAEAARARARSRESCMDGVHSVPLPSIDGQRISRENPLIAQGGGVKKSGGRALGTEPLAKFFRAGNPGGGVSPAGDEGAC